MFALSSSGQTGPSIIPQTNMCEINMEIRLSANLQCLECLLQQLWASLVQKRTLCIWLPSALYHCMYPGLAGECHTLPI